MNFIIYFLLRKTLRYKLSKPELGVGGKRCNGINTPNHSYDMCSVSVDDKPGVAGFPTELKHSESKVDS